MLAGQDRTGYAQEDGERLGGFRRARPLPAADGKGRLHLSRDHTSRTSARYDDSGLGVVTVSRKGAEAVRQRLEIQEKAIEDLQGQRAELTSRFREPVTLSPPPSLLERFHMRTDVVVAHEASDGESRSRRDFLWFPALGTHLVA